MHTLDGGPTLNPSTYELLAGIHAVPAEEVVVLPNSANVIMAAERAAELSEKQVVVVPSPSQQTGLVAALALAPDALGRGERAARSPQALARVRTGSVAPAARDDAEGRFSAARRSASSDEALVAWGDARGDARAVLARAAAGRTAAS